MEAFDTPHDLVDAINEAKAHVFQSRNFLAEIVARV